ncbi:MAG: c-type cytochrome, partial [Planctomycetes bacterium]|nr:c-type cytochrome [Planctomycetota bacterium]
MAIRIDRRSGSAKRRWWFAGSSLLMVAALIRLVWVDYDRPWRQYQDRYFDNQAALAHLRSLGAPDGRPDGRQPPAVTRVDARHRTGRPTSTEPGQAPDSPKCVNLPLLDSIAPRNTPGKHRINQVVLPGVRQQLNYVETGTTERCTTCHAAIDNAAFAEAELAATLEAALPAVNDALEHLGYDRPGFPAPPPVKRDDGATFDVGRVTEHWDWLDDSERQAYLATLLEVTNEYLRIRGGPQIRFEPPLRAHPNLDLYVSSDSPHPLSTTGCTVCHEGNPRETDFVLAAHSPADRTAAKRWEAEHLVTRFGVPIWTFDQAARSWNHPMLPMQYTEAGCAKCHHRVTDVSGVGVGNHGTRLDRGRHLFKSLGCMNCHEVATIGRVRQVGPDLTRIAAKLTPQFIRDWVLEPQRFRPSTRMPHFFDQENNRTEAGDELDPDPAARSAAEVAGMVTYLFAVSDPVELHPVPRDVTPKVSWGRELFKSFGCLACHASVTEFGDSWIADYLAQRDEINRITARERSETMSVEEQVRYAVRHFPGEFEAIARTGGGRRHREDRDTPPALTRFAPELSAAGSKVSFEWLYSWLIEPAHFAADTKMPNLRLPPAEAAHLASYLATLDGGEAESAGTICDEACHRTANQLLASLLSAQRSSEDLAAVLADRDGRLTRMLMAQLADSLGDEQAHRRIASMDSAEKRLTLLGSRMISHYGCYTCHHIAGFEDAPRPGTELTRWGEKPITRLDFASFDPGLARESTEDPAATTYLYPLGADRLTRRSFVGNPEIHVSRSRASFANHKLLNPRMWDRQLRKPPYEKLKMPNFYLAQDEVDALVAYLLSNQPARVADELRVDYRDTPAGMIATGRDLAREYNCIACHELDGNGVLIWQYLRPPDMEDRSFEIAPPSLRNEGARVQSEWLIR